MNPVADSGPIISFSRAGQVELLRAVLPQLIVPAAVYQEVAAYGTGRPGSDLFETDPPWLTVQTLKDPALLTSIRTSLHAGEQEVLALALELGNRPIVMDERAGRNEARRLGIPVLTSLGVIRQARHQGLIPAARPIVESLLAHSFRLHPTVLEEYLRDLGEL